MVETKVTAAAVASAVVPLVMLLASVFNWGLDEATAYNTVLTIGLIASPVITFVAGWWRKSRTSAVSVAYSTVEAQRAQAKLREGSGGGPLSDAGYGLIEVLVAVLLIIIIVVVLMRVV